MKFHHVSFFLILSLFFSLSHASLSASFSPLITGLVAAPFTPFSLDGSVNYDQVPDIFSHLVETGVGGAYVCGTTGESLSLTVSERKGLAEAWVRAAEGSDFSVIIHVGAESLEDAKTLAEHAESLGVKAIGMMPTTFFRPSGIPALVNWMKLIADAAPNTPFFYYHIPSMTDVEVNVKELLSEAKNQIKTLTGVKYTDYNLYDFSECVHFDANGTDHGPYNMLFGKDEVLLAALSMGADGAVGSTYNYLGKTANALISSFTTGDLKTATFHQRRIQSIVDLLVKYGGTATGKAIMRFVGIDVGIPRPPILSLSEQTLKELYNDLVAIDFFKWV